MQLELTETEAKALIGLLDIATKAGGLEVAQHAMPLAVKIQTELTKEPENVPSDN